MSLHLRLLARRCKKDNSAFLAAEDKEPIYPGRRSTFETDEFFFIIISLQLFRVRIGGGG